MTVERMARRGRPKNIWERTTKKDIEKLSVTGNCVGIGRSGVSRYQDQDDVA